MSGPSRMARWLLAQDPDMLGDQRRIIVQVSMTPGLFLSVLQVGPHGHGRSTYYGKTDSPEGAIEAALAAEEADDADRGRRRSHGRRRA